MSPSTRAGDASETRAGPTKIKRTRQKRLELADARADEGGNIAFGRVLAERALGQRCGRQAPGSTLVLAAREGSHPLSKG